MKTYIFFFVSVVVFAFLGCEKNEKEAYSKGLSCKFSYITQDSIDLIDTIPNSLHRYHYKDMSFYSETGSENWQPSPYQQGTKPWNYRNKISVDITVNEKTYYLRLSPTDVDTIKGIIEKGEEYEIVKKVFYNGVEIKHDTIDGTYTIIKNLP